VRLKAAPLQGQMQDKAFAPSTITGAKAAPFQPLPLVPLSSSALAPACQGLSPWEKGEERGHKGHLEGTIRQPYEHASA